MEEGMASSSYSSLLLVSGSVMAILAMALALVLVVQWLRWMYCRNGLPGPWPIPLLGNLHLLLTSEAPHRKLAQMARKYGPLIHLQMGVAQTIVVSSPESAHQVLLAHDKSLASRPYSSSANRLMYGLGNFIFMTPYNDQWRFIRKFYSTHMFSPRRIHDQNLPILHGEILRSISSHVYPASLSASELNLSKLFSALVQDSLYYIVLSKRPSDLSTKSNDIYEATRKADQLLSINRIGELIPMLGFLDRGLDKAIDGCHRLVDDVLEGVLAEREQRRKDDHEFSEEGKAAASTCVLDTMLACDPPLDRVQIKAMMMELTVSGSNTTAAALEWMMTELLNNKRVMRKAVEELDRVVGKERMVSLDDFQDNKMPYIRAIVKETLRLHPPAPLMLPHFALESCDIQIPKNKRTSYSSHGSTPPLDHNEPIIIHRIAAGTRVMINVWAINRDEATWGPSPTEFLPERFMVSEGGGGREVDVKGQDFGLLPFGSGRRMCPGMAFAIPLLELTIATFLHCFEWKRSNNEEINNASDIPEDMGLTVLRSSHLQAVPTSFRLSLPIHHLTSN